MAAGVRLCPDAASRIEWLGADPGLCLARLGGILHVGRIALPARTGRQQPVAVRRAEHPGHGLADEAPPVFLDTD